MGSNESISTDSVKQSIEEFVNHVERVSELHDLDDIREEGIKVKIITPLVKQLGWDIMTPEVKFEVWTGEGDADYALCIDDEPEVLIEAKATHKSPGSAKKQLHEYLEASSTAWGLSSNGRRYALYKHKAGSIETKFVAEYRKLPKYADELANIHQEQITA